jgi:ATP-dependent Zn protease
MDTNAAPDPAPQPSDGRTVLWGVLITFVLLLLVVGLFTLMIYRTQGAGNYYDYVMNVDAREQREAKDTASTSPASEASAPE